MKYFSTRNKSLEFSFKDIFLRGLAPDGGLFLPSEIKQYNQSELKNLSKLSYVNLATEIIFNFCKDDIDKDQLTILIEKAYSNFESKEVVKLKKVGNHNLLELYHGPTLAFKDIAMQVIGNMYDYLEVSKNKVVNIIVATSGDTGSAAISALNDRKNINVFVLHPHNKISNIQRKIMTTIGSNNVFNLAVEGSFDDCQNIVKEMFNDNEFRKKINMSGVNSINWARIICQIVYYFYAFFKVGKKNISFSVPTGNFGDIYAGYMAKKMGLPIDKLIVATNENNILQRVINTGEYRYQVNPSAPIIYNWAQITGIAVSRYNRNGEDITPMIPVIVNSIIKIADIGTSTSLGYGLYRVTSSTSLSNGAAYLLTLEPRGAVSSVGNDVISLAPFGSGSFEYVEDFSLATATWVINHNLGKYPSVSTVDSAGSIINGAITYNNENKITVVFTSATSGKAYLN